jgi:hypothetical protein
MGIPAIRVGPAAMGRSVPDRGSGGETGTAVL